MSALSLLVSILSFSSVVLLVMAIPNLTKKKTNISKFSAEWDGEGIEQLDKVKEVKNKYKRNTPVVMFMTILGSFTGFVVLFIVTGLVSASLLGLAVGFIVPKLIANNYHKNQRKLTTMQLEQAAEVMSSVLRSGSGIVDALTRAAKEIGNPLSDELVSTANEIRLGVPSSVAFENLSRRVGYDELRILSMAINLQQEGMAVNLSLLLSQIQENIRYKIAFQRDVNVITAENRMAGWIVAVLPFATLAITRLMMPDIIAPLFNTTIGLAVFGISVVVIGIGVFWMLKIAEIEV